MTELSKYTSLRVGGPATKIVQVSTEAQIIAAIEEAGDTPILIMGGGTNVLIADKGFEGTVIRISNNSVQAEVDACSGATLTIGAGEDWDTFVQTTIASGFAGLETLSGIPGTVGAAPIQNIGAYGHEVSEVIARVRTWDRKAGAYKTFSNSECEFSYRSSVFKKNPGRYVIIDVTFQLRKGEMSLPITYKELASYLGVELEARALVSDVRKAVLALRAAKGMLLDSNDHDTWSAGSFFVNPILSAEAAAKLPADAPRWVQDDGRVKTSAAWLMEHAGVKKGQIHNGAGVSSKHVLALVNTGSATAADIVDMARLARSAVKDKFGIVLEPEVQFVGLSL